MPFVAFEDRQGDLTPVHSEGVLAVDGYAAIDANPRHEVLAFIPPRTAREGRFLEPLTTG